MRSVEMLCFGGCRGLITSRACLAKVSGSSPRDVAKHLRDQSMVFKGPRPGTNRVGSRNSGNSPCNPRSTPTHGTNRHSLRPQRRIPVPGLDQGRQCSPEFHGKQIVEAFVDQVVHCPRRGDFLKNLAGVESSSEQLFSVEASARSVP